MKSFTLAVVAAFAALCQADSFAVPVPWVIDEFTLYEPERRAPGIGGIWVFNIRDSTPGPQGFNTRCQENLKYDRIFLGNPDWKVGISKCEDSSVHWTTKFVSPTCSDIIIGHNYPCDSPTAALGKCLDQVVFPFCVDEYLTKSDQGAMARPVFVQTRPMSMYPKRDILSTTETTL